MYADDAPASDGNGSRATKVPSFCLRCDGPFLGHAASGAVREQFGSLLCVVVGQATGVKSASFTRACPVNGRRRSSSRCKFVRPESLVIAAPSAPHSRRAAVDRTAGPADCLGVAVRGKSLLGVPLVVRCSSLMTLLELLPRCKLPNCKAVRRDASSAWLLSGCRVSDDSDGIDPIRQNREILCFGRRRARCQKRPDGTMPDAARRTEPVGTGSLCAGIGCASRLS